MYVPFSLEMSPQHVMALAHGGAVRIYPKHHNRGHKLQVTKGQHTRMMNSTKSGRPIVFRMSLPHFKHNVKHGSGIFSDVWDKIKSGARTVYEVARPVIEPIAREGINRVVDAGKKRIGRVADTYITRAENAINGDGLYNNPVYNTGRYRNRSKKVLVEGDGLYNNPVYDTGRYRARGDGFFDDVWGGIKSVANTVAPVVLPIASSIITKRLGGKLRKKRVKKDKGGSPFPIGSRP